MKVKSSIALVGTGIMGTLLYQNIRSGNMKNLVSKMNKAKNQVVNNLEEMM